ncbi:alpha/beta hydrolase-fold protein [Micromonospora sp. WMMD1120]|uniref:alpha/beta hydrolase n=1 Tax=Micromonospora sp. WMMD1120 TaxID=3016106 RepID=UPI002417E6F8|nr:alpha/beta hydrolase-fold protein [Micromonospora sp. WMMD1120]MDG4810740.1 alpha/beta hydrolase-fold protein [Micromonospora sp. WMMD1120]
MTTEQYHGRLRRLGVRRLSAAVTAGVIAVAAVLVAPQPATADTPWLAVSDDRYATFTVPASYVQEQLGTVSQVVVEGNFGPSASWAEFGLTRRGDAWSGVLGALRPGLYHYQLTADDTKTIKDPTNSTSVASHPLWSSFLVAGDAARWLGDAPAGTGGAVASLTYRVRAEQRSALVWTPPGYSARGPKRYPTLFLESGADAAVSDWLDLGRTKQILDNLSAAGAIQPMVVVIADSADDRELTDLRRAVADTYRVHRDPAHQAIAGVSDGAARAVRVAFAKPGRFGYVGWFSGDSTPSVDRKDAKAINRDVKLLRVYTGNVTDAGHNPTYRLTKALDSAGVRFAFDGVNPDGGGNWTTWQENLVDFLPRLFRPGSDHGPTPGHGQLTGEFTPPPAGTTPTPFVTEDGFVTFETTTDFTAAQHVTVWANIAPGGSWLRVPLTRDGDRWRATIGPLKPWFYYYRLIVDRVPVKDVSNPTRVTTEPMWSTFLIPGPEARLLTDVPAGQGGKVESMTYSSTVAGQDRTALVWTPPGYDPDRAQPYPVLYLQHGGGQNHTDWVEMGRAKQILDNQFLDGDLTPMVVVMGNGNSSDFNRELLENIVPTARSRYHISSDPSQQALAGLSMGGGQAFGVLRAYPGRFAYVAAFSAGFGSGTGVDVAAINNGTKMLRLYVGDQTDFVYPSFMTSLATLDNLGIRYEFDGVTPGPHGWDVWQKNLIDLAPRLFKR